MRGVLTIFLGFLFFNFFDMGHCCPDTNKLHQKLSNDQALWLFNLINSYGDPIDTRTQRNLFNMVKYERLHKCDSTIAEFFPKLKDKQLFSYPQLGTNVKTGSKSTIFYALDINEEKQKAVMASTGVHVVDEYGNYQMSDCLFTKFQQNSIEDNARDFGWRGNCKNDAESSQCLQEELRKLRQNLYQCDSDIRSVVSLDKQYRIINIWGCPHEECCGMELSLDTTVSPPTVNLAKYTKVKWEIRPIDIEGDYFNIRSLFGCDKKPKGEWCKVPMTWVTKKKIITNNYDKHFDNRYPKIYINKNDPIIWQVKPRGNGWQIINKWGCCGRHMSCNKDLMWYYTFDKNPQPKVSIRHAETDENFSSQNRDWMIVRTNGECRAIDDTPCSACPRPKDGLCPKFFGIDLCT